VRTAIDANIISSIWSWEPTAEKVVEQLGKAKQEGALLISPFAFSELHAHPNMTASDVRSSLVATDVAIDYKLEERIWTEAGVRYARYAARRRKATGEGPRRLLADFLIGAHALVQAERLLTLDPTRYRQDFPELRLL
jgi:predicted nucleic acid-binding protein